MKYGSNKIHHSPFVHFILTGESHINELNLDIWNWYENHKEMKNLQNDMYESYFMIFLSHRHADQNTVKQ